MRFLLFFIIFTNITYTNSGNAGSTIFYNKRARDSCWNDDDIIKLRARKVFEELLPAQVQPDEIDGKYIRELLRYLRRTLHSVGQDSDPRAATLLKEAMADTLGAHLRNEILPSARFAFYAGYVPYRNVRQIHDLYTEIKELLNTQGLGWLEPERTPKWSNLSVAKIIISAQSFFNPCTCLVLKRDVNSCIHLPTPRLDDDTNPSAIALPFKTGGLVSLTSPASNNVLLKYYTTASRCILTDSPENCRHSDFLSFNDGLWNWMKRDVAPHLLDEKLYAAYGGILRIAAAVQTYGKGLSRRNLFEYHDAQLTKWHPWKTLTQSYISVDTDWSPTLYIGAVFAIALLIYAIQIIYNLCSSGSCNCKGRSSFFSKQVSYANMVSNMSPTVPSPSTIYYNDPRRRRSSSKTKSASLGSVRTQKVYDLNENTEKLMAIVSGNEKSEVETTSSESESENIVEVRKEKGVDNPPRIETSISEVRIDRRKKSELPYYSTSTVTRNTYEVQRTSDSAGSASESSTSQTVSSTSSKSCKSSSFRDLERAKRVISKYSASVRSTKSSSRTEMDLNSFTTPPSQR